MFRNSLTRLGRRAAFQRWTAAALRPTTVAVRTLASTGGAALADLKAANPHVDVVWYEHKNRSWSLNHVDYYSTAMAIGLIDAGLQPADVVLSWLPEHFSEQVSICVFVLMTRKLHQKRELLRRHWIDLNSFCFVCFGISRQALDCSFGIISSHIFFPSFYWYIS